VSTWIVLGGGGVVVFSTELGGVSFPVPMSRAIHMVLGRLTAFEMGCEVDNAFGGI